MAGKATTLAIKITSDNQTKAGFADASRDVGGFSDKLDKANVIAGVALAGIGALGKATFDMASDAQQNAGAVEAVFHQYAAGIESTAAAAASEVGLSTSAYDQMAAVLGSQLGNLGLGMDEVVGRTEQLISMGADLAAQFGGTTADAVEALTAVLRGETDPIERYGVSIKQSDINARLAAEGQDKLTGSAAKAAQAHAVLAMLTQQTANANGEFAKEADTAQGQQQRATAAFQDAEAKLGQGLLPVMTKLFQIATKVGNWAGDHTSTIATLAGVFAGLAIAVGAVNGVMAVWNTLTKIATGLQIAWDFALDANPIGIIVIAIAAVVAGVILMYNKFKWFRDFLHGVGAVFGMVFDAVMKPLKWVADKIQWLMNIGGAVFHFVMGKLFGAPAGGGGGQPAGAPGGLIAGAAPGGLALRAAGLASPAGAGAAPAGAGGSGFDLAPVYVTVNMGVVGDPVEAGRQLVGVLRDYGRATGREVVATMGRAGA